MEKFSAGDIRIITSAINEVVRGIGVKDLKIKTGSDEEAILSFDKSLHDLGESLRSAGQSEFESKWSCEDLQLIKKLLSELFKELDHFEFETRMGHGEDEVWQILKKVREAIDDTCYPRSI